MKSLFVYDRPMCCSTGICGPAVDPVLPRFAADLDWVRAQGCTAERFNLSQQPMAFVQNPLVQQTLAAEGTPCLPLIIVDGQIVSRGQYPSRETLAGWLDISPKEAILPVLVPSSGCCGGTPGCC